MDTANDSVKKVALHFGVGPAQLRTSIQQSPRYLRSIGVSGEEALGNSSAL